MQWLATHTGLGATSHLEAGGFIRSREGLRHPDIQFHFLPSAVIDHGRVVVDREAYQVSARSSTSLSFDFCTHSNKTISKMSDINLLPRSFICPLKSYSSLFAYERQSSIYRDMMQIGARYSKQAYGSILLGRKNPESRH